MEGLPLEECRNCCESLFVCDDRDESTAFFELIRDEPITKLEWQENIPLCRSCLNILIQLNASFEEFAQVRKLESYISRQIQRVHEVEPLEDLGKLEDQQPKVVLQGPWVVLKRLKSDEIPCKNRSQTGIAVKSETANSYEDNFEDNVTFSDAESNHSEGDTTPAKLSEVSDYSLIYPQDVKLITNSCCSY
ncbi:unnamed protein product [Allacma fusca]|uniref:Uncharacterized protein n=1 Tax=Allacma fusca TaxID=39272 RepID=A0A8J2KKS4_9HEXA|nr:unnamed protein product [Allacma fusca]